MKCTTISKNSPNIFSKKKVMSLKAHVHFHLLAYRDLEMWTLKLLFKVLLVIVMVSVSVGILLNLLAIISPTHTPVTLTGKAIK